MTLFSFFLLVSLSLATASPVRPGQLRRWEGEDDFYYPREQQRFRRQGGGRPLAPAQRRRPEPQFQPRRGPITQNRQLRPAQTFRASQPELAERRVVESYEREEDTFQTYPETRMKAPARRPERPERQAILDSEISESVPAPSQQRDIEAAVNAGAAAYKGESYSQPQKVSFQIHGQGGPHSYRFGYDTGVGYNRQFRYEERDAAGVLHGRYGYYDQEGKLQIVNYTADPQTGFHAEGEHVPKPQY